MNGHRRSSIITLGALILAVGVAAACAQQQQNGPGHLAVQLVDAPNPAVDAIWVNVTSVRAHVVGSGWKTVSTTPVRVDLLKLKTAVQELGLVDLPAGTVTQIRLLVAKDGNTVVTAAGEAPLVVPSGFESGIKINGPWEIGPCALTTVTLDFDGLRSLAYHPTGSGDEWILRPVIRTKKAERTPASCDGGQESGGPGGAGTACTDLTQCLSGECNDGTCAPGGPGVPCAVAADCASGTCAADGTCAPGDAGGAGAPCTAETQCLSNACVTGACAPGSQGAPCTAPADCAEGFTCSGSVAGSVCVDTNSL